MQENVTEANPKDGTGPVTFALQFRSNLICDILTSKNDQLSFVAKSTTDESSGKINQYTG